MSKRGPANPERSFGISVGAVLLLISAALIWYGRMTAAEILAPIGAILLLFGLTKPSLLKYPSALWWKFALALGYVNMRILLTVAFLVMLTPIGLLWRVTGHDPLRRRRESWNGWSPSPERFKKPDHFKRMY